jgi:hypothetical protein
MEYNKIIAVTGLPGLYELLSSKTDGAIVRSLDDKSTRFVSSRIHNFSHLESIEVYTVRDNVNLVDVLKAMEASAEKLPDEKDNSALKAYFGKVYPDLDFDRVYTSDLKKMVKWFSVLRSNNIEIKLSEPEAEETEAPVEEEVTEEKPAPKKKATKEAGSKATDEAADGTGAAIEKSVKAKAAAKEPAAKEKEAKATKAAAAEEKPKAKKPAAKKSDEEKETAEDKKKTTKKKS